jgi:hypothetical protein
MRENDFSNPYRILTCALRAGYRDEIGVSLEFKAANAAPEKYRILVYFFHNILLVKT